ncbi:hypothetical protein BT96DRAFT_832335 [Gymnopus androsaceus JB14]|uniref:Derlin n=1 Tax=Gymnopus androsaceus JB14 TaxID=1447944 RepID=A0A6A4H0C8_9AGAR|nr:hypothetical protein BT96DRAFT_832335 [Gymnopus androsaceus JB14]
MDAIVAKLKKIPPVTRFLCISLVSVSVTKFQVWRLWSSFLLGIRALAFFFEMGILYRTGKRLEQGPYLRKSADLAYQLVIASGAIIAVNILVKGMLFFHPFLCCIIYLSSKLTPPGAQTLRTSLYGLGFIPVKYFPFALLAIDLLNGGPYGAVLSVLGMIISHLWWVGIWGSELGGRSGPLAAYGRAPRWLARWFGEETAPSNTRPGAGRGTNSGSGAHAAPPRNIAAPSNRGPGAGERCELGKWCACCSSSN